MGRWSNPSRAAKDAGERVAVWGSGSKCVAFLSETGTAELVLFRFTRETQTPPGARLLVSGKLDVFNGRLTIAHPEHLVPFDQADRIPTIEPVWPLGTDSILISNDGGFGASGNATAFHLSAQIPWTLKQTGVDRLPKTVYLRFLGAGIDNQNFTDDIILDELAPTLSTAQLVGSTGAAGDIPSAHAEMSVARHARRYAIRLSARDTIVGLCQVAFSDRKSGGQIVQIRSCRQKGVLHLNRVVTLKAAKRPKYVRVRNSAGSWSRWLRLR